MSCRWPLGFLLAALATVIPAREALSYEFYVRRADTRLVEEVYRLDARIDYQLSATAREALASGVPLTIAVTIRVERKRDWLWDRTVAMVEQRFELATHALSGRYVVTNLNTGVSNSYATLDDALDAMGSLDGFPLLDAGLLAAGGDYEVTLRAHLDIEALPAPLRPLAYFDPDWRLSSDTFAWPLGR